MIRPKIELTQPAAAHDFGMDFLQMGMYAAKSSFRTLAERLENSGKAGLGAANNGSLVLSD
ncbi:MAG: hypothetical protein K1W22_08305 [Lachnospiraceae bacterium]